MSVNDTRRRDRGMALPMVLVVVVVFGLIVVGIATYATANLRFGQVTEDRSDQLAAADAAMQYAVDLLQIGRADCIYSDVEVALPQLGSQFNGATGSVKCDTVSGGLSNTRDYAMALTGEGLAANDALILTKGGSVQKILTGPVFMQRVTNSSFDLSTSAGITMRNGPLLHFGGAPPCTAVAKSSLPNGVEFEPDLIFGPVCTPSNWYDVFGVAFDEPPIRANLEGLALRDGTALVGALTTWPTIGVTQVLGSYTLSGACRIYEPGRYLRPPNLNDVYAYFKSGDYFFDFRNPSSASPTGLSYAQLPSASRDYSNFVINKSNVTAGKLDTSVISAPELLNHADCVTAANSESGFGATFYMSGLAHVTIANQGALEIMPRNQGSASDPSYVAIHALCNPTATTNNQSRWCTSSGSATSTPFPSTLVAPASNANSSTNPSIVYTDPGNNREMVANGLIYAPLAQMEFGNVTNTAIQKMKGGLVLARAILQSATSAQNFEIGVSTAAADSVIRLTATGTQDGNTTQIRAIAEYNAEASYNASVALNSWRVCEGQTC